MCLKFWNVCMLTDYDEPDGYGDEDDDGPPWDEEDDDGEEADK